MGDGKAAIQTDASLLDENGAAVKEANEKLYHAASKTAEGRIIVKLVNVSGKEKTIILQLEGGDFSRRTQGTMPLLSGQKRDTNGLTAEKDFQCQPLYPFLVAPLKSPCPAMPRW